MVLKIAASIVIVICCGLLGLQKANRYVQRVREIRLLKNALIQLETEVIHFSSFVSEAMARVGESLQGPLKAFFCKTAEYLEDRTEYTVGECWKKALDKYRKELSIGQPEYEILVRFGEKLGTSDRESQKKYFELVQNQLQVEEYNAEQLRLKYEKMYRSLGILFGLAIAIILF